MTQLIQQAYQWSPPQFHVTDSRNLTSSCQPCTPKDLADLEHSELLLEPIESEESTASLPTTAVSNLLQDVVQQYNNENNRSSQIIQNNIEMTSKTLSPTQQHEPINTSFSQILNQAILQDTSSPVFNPLLFLPNSPLPTPSIAPLS